jgi:hypothetical protein
LEDEELAWSGRFRNGAIAFLDGQLGISLKNAHPGLFARVDDYYYIGIKQKYFPNEMIEGVCCLLPVGKVEQESLAEFIEKKGASSYAKLIDWYIPSGPGTFLPIDAPIDQQQVMLSLVNLTGSIERLIDEELLESDVCEETRMLLNSQYDEFVADHVSLRQSSSYFDSPFWLDLRMQIHLLGLEDEHGTKAHIFDRRMNKREEKIEQLFLDEDTGVRIAKAFSWCMGKRGKAIVSVVAAIAGLDEDLALASMLEQELVYRA